MIGTMSLVWLQGSRLREHFVDNIAVDVRQPEVPSLEAMGQARVVEPQEMK